MPWTNITERDSSAYKAMTDSSVASVAVVGAMGRGLLNTVMEPLGVEDFFKTCGDRSENLSSNTWLGVYRLLSASMPVKLVRVAGSGAAKASATVLASGGSTTIITVKAKSEGVWGNNLTLTVTPGTGSKATITVKNGSTTLETFLVSALSTDTEYIGKLSPTYVSLTDAGTGTARTFASATDTALTGGNDGSAPSITDYTNAIALFKDLALYNVFFITTFDAQTPEIQTALVSAAKERADCLALLSAPAGYTSATTMQWFEGTASGGPASAFDTSFGAGFGPHQFVSDGTQKVWMPAQLFYLEGVARSLRAGNYIWQAVAGVKRGTVSGTISSEFPVGNAILALWQPRIEGTCVNPIVNNSTVGPMLYGNRTLQKSSSSLRSLNVRCLANYIRKVIMDVCVGLTFEQNESAMWESFRGLVGAALTDIKNKKGIDSFFIQMDAGTVTPAEQDALRVPGQVIINPTRPGEDFDITFTLTQAGVTFGQ